MRSSRIVLARIVVFCLLFVSVTDIFAKRRYHRDRGSDCLSRWKVDRLAKQALPELRAIDSSVTRTDVKRVISTVGSCKTTDAVSTALEAYGDELKLGSESTTDADTVADSERVVVDHTPVAVSDSATTRGNRPVTIDVLANDTGLEDSPITVTVPGTPANGLVVLESTKLTYTPNTDFGGEDTMTYAIKDVDGDFATGMVRVTVDCDGCMTSNPVITLSWDPAAGDVTGYRVYSGTTPENSTVWVANVATPSIEFNASDDLGLVSGEPVCFSVTAYNGVAESDFSPAVCATL